MDWDDEPGDRDLMEKVGGCLGVLLLISIFLFIIYAKLKLHHVL